MVAPSAAMAALSFAPNCAARRATSAVLWKAVLIGLDAAGEVSAVGADFLAGKAARATLVAGDGGVLVVAMTLSGFVWIVGSFTPRALRF